MKPARVLSIATLAAALLALPLAARTEGPSAADLLHDAMNAPLHDSYVGEIQTLRIGDEKSDASIYRIEHKAPNLTRRWYLAPQALYGDSLITRNDTTYSVDVKRNRVVISHDPGSDDQVAQNDTFNLLLNNYHEVADPDESVAGRPVHVISIVNKYTGEPTMRVWVDSSTKLLLQKEEYAPNGSVAAETRYTHVRYTDNIPNAAFTVPSNYKSIRGADRGAPTNDYKRLSKSAGFNARSPRYLPDGFFVVTGDVVSIKDVRTVHLLYSDGIRTVSLFENAKDAAIDLSRYQAQTTHFEGHDAQYVIEGPTTLLAWSEANLHFALVGELDRAELQKIAASVVP